MTQDEILTHLHLLMKKKSSRKLSGSYEIRAYREEAQRLKQRCRLISEGKHGKCS
jgi:hypothetical protein